MLAVAPQALIDRVTIQTCHTACLLYALKLLYEVALHIVLANAVGMSRCNETLLHLPNPAAPCIVVLIVAPFQIVGAVVRLALVFVVHDCALIPSWHPCTGYKLMHWL